MIKKSFSLQSRFIVLTLIMCFIILVTGAFVFQGIKMIENISGNVLEFDRQIENLKNNFAERHLLLAELRKSETRDQSDHLIFKINGITTSIHEQIQSLPAKTFDNKFQFPILELKRGVASYEAGMKGVIDTLQLEKSTSKSAADRILANVVSVDYAKIIRNLFDYQTIARQSSGHETLTSGIESVKFWAFVIFTISIFLGILMPFIFFRPPLSKIKKVNKVINKLKLGETISEKLGESDDEVGQIAIGINSLSQNLDKAAAFAKDVGQGHFETKFEVSSEKDRLGEALVEMRDRLRDVAIDESRRNWAIAGMAQFGEILRSHEDLQTFADHVISDLTKYIHAIQGGFFISQPTLLYIFFLLKN